MKKTFRVILICIFIGIAICSVLLVYKPGASIFHFKKKIISSEIIHRDGYSFRYQIILNSLVFPLENIILYEDGKPLERTHTKEVVISGQGNYSIVDKDDGLVYVNFSPSDNSNPLTNGKSYTVYYKAIFLSRGLGFTLLGILSLLLAWFLIFVVKSTNQKQPHKYSQLTFSQLVDEFLFREIPGVITPITNQEVLTHSRRGSWIFLLVLTVAAAYFYVFMEWLFFATKPSFMDLMGWYEKVELFLIPGFAFAILSLVLLLVIAGIDYLSSRLYSASLFIFIGTLIPSIILTAISLLLLDNFTYTILNFGVVTAEGIWRFLYGIFTLIFFIFINNRILKNMGLRGRSKSQIVLPRFTYALIAGLLLISAVVILFRYDVNSSSNTQEVSLVEENNQFAAYPNILLIGSDGLTASNLSVYGYERDTTPILSELAKTSLLAENAFANSTGSTGSITAMLTGKAPAQTRVFNSQNILQGIDVYQHLPGIFNKEGYSTVEFGVRNYVDAYQVNMLDGFDTVNGRSLEGGEVVRLPGELGFTEHEYFASRLVERISDRILHLAFLRKMENPFTIVTQHVGMMYDRERLDKLLELIRYSDQPLFVHVHMMGTHGPRFFPEKRIFSSGRIQDQDDMIDFYDDSIVNFDSYVGEVLETLQQTGKINNTILIIYSDHPMKKHQAKLRVPLLIHFPNGEFAGRIRANVQGLDIPPTILDYVGVEQPGWMVGESLLNGDPPQDRLIFYSESSNGTQIGQDKIDLDVKPVIPPSYNLLSYGVINCQKWYKLNLVDLTLSRGDIPDHSSPCSEENLLTIEQIEEALAIHLLSQGFDISALQ